ncbi:hypothetical protein DMTZ50_1304 [Dehalococcoides mccartyi]|uniref:Uncharacterized protein n=1 Tax=Dehalococcoides mccartyi TaxID=61435 RepID=A0A142VAN9_9CHLR|nr:hypothetical protein X794_05230 [Dehalococcoides mccartyi CG5]AMU86906.1 hypothetical protein Dm11a5_1080 [Dehalococcoides mccartyi]AOV99696.1 hypothetical protein DCWBC2_1071 [Dehalococcoides mccartyi]MBA2085475.1 hypothetical protein [Dehalococcoides mccartyi]
MTNILLRLIIIGLVVYEVNMYSNVVEQAWQRCGGKCECKDQSHAHTYIRCNRKLIYENKDKPRIDGWKVVYLTGVAADTAENIRIYCHSCFKQD